MNDEDPQAAMVDELAGAERADPIIYLRPERTDAVTLDALAQRFGASVNWPAHSEAADSSDETAHAVRGVTISTDNVRDGDLWVGLPGLRTHGARFARTAHELGAVAVLTDSAGVQVMHDEGFTELPVIVLEEPRTRLGDICAMIYGTEHPEPVLLGITGTNGKTSITHMLRDLLELLEIPSAGSSTVERWVGGERVVAGLTTPEAPDVHALIAVARERALEIAEFEVSVQAITRHRVDGIVFDVVGFTNLAHDHLEDFGDMDTYFGEKVEFFTKRRARRGVVSLETEWGERMVERSEVPVVTVGQSHHAHADWRVTVFDTTTEGTRFILEDNRGRSLDTRSQVPGPHMAQNMAVAIVMLLEAGVNFDDITRVLCGGADLPVIPGRTENIAGDDSPAVYLDFGHTADAFEYTLQSIREITEGRVITVYGADGDRYKSKRYGMGAQAARFSDLVIVTDHHPRFEDAAEIRKQLAEGALRERPDIELYEITPPSDAIRLAVSRAQPGDAIVWFGPGHQGHREIRGVRTKFSAREDARAALLEAGYSVRSA